jgi:TolB-like protein/Tfp pilus assembly protein PilF
VSDLSDRLAAALVDRYAIERELGRGGMATVFLARDLRHRRSVAIKVLHPELAAALGPERFLREIETVAGLQHPHILPLHDSGGAVGLLWYAMPYVQGESLRSRLTREKQLPVEDALDIAIAVAAALAYAHERGVIHRDIKPENILLEGDEAVVADFGIARAVDSAGGTKLTETGMAVGTVTYMSPEQAAGERELDGRSDVYSLGCVLYEMLAGEPPFTGPTVQAVFAKRFSEPIAPISRVRPSVPPAAELVVMKALASVPADRWPSARLLRQELAALRRAPTDGTRITPVPVPSSRLTPSVPDAPGRRRPNRLLLTIAAAGVVLIAGLGVTRYALGRRSAAVAAGPKMVAVLPFKNMGAAEDQYFSDGLTEEITSRLAAVAGLGVISRTSADQYRNTTKALRQIGHELGAGYVLEGSVRWEKAGGKSRIRVTPQLIQVADDRHLWADRYDADLADVFQIQGQIAEQVTSALNVALAEPERRALAAKPTANLGAYDLYLQGNKAAAGFDQVAPVELRRAIGFYERAVALDSTFALAWAQLSRAHSLLYYTGMASTQTAERARVAAERALRIDSSLAVGHLALADYYNYLRQDWPHALAEYALARKAAPNNPDALKGAAIVARSQGQWQQSQASFQQAQALDPRSIATARRLAVTQLWLRHYPEALEAAERALDLDPRAPDLHQVRVMISLAQGDLAAARTEVRAAESQVEQTAFVAWMATYWDLYWALDEKQQALLLRLPPGPFDDNRASWGLALAATYALRGDQPRTRAYADSARLAVEEQLKDAPDDGNLLVQRAIALAYEGRRLEAVQAGERGISLWPTSRDAYTGAYVQHQLARVYIILGDQERALDLLEPLLKSPYYLSPGWLKVDPTFDPLRKNPRFQRLLSRTS